MKRRKIVGWLAILSASLLLFEAIALPFEGMYEREEHIKIIGMGERILFQLKMAGIIVGVPLFCFFILYLFVLGSELLSKK